MGVHTIVFPLDWPPLPEESGSRVWGGQEGHGVVRVSVNPPLPKPLWRGWHAALTKFAHEAGLETGETVLLRTGTNGVGPYRLRIGKDPQHGLTGCCLVGGPITVLATYDMGSLDHASEDLEAFAAACEQMTLAGA